MRIHRITKERYQGFTVVVKKWYDTTIWEYGVFFRRHYGKHSKTGEKVRKNKMNILAPSILSADCTILGKQIEDVKKGGAEYLHRMAPPSGTRNKTQDNSMPWQNRRTKAYLTRFQGNLSARKIL